MGLLLIGSKSTSLDDSCGSSPRLARSQSWKPTSTPSSSSSSKDDPIVATSGTALLLPDGGQSKPLRRKSGAGEPRRGLSLRQLLGRLTTAGGGGGGGGGENNIFVSRKKYYGKLSSTASQHVSSSTMSVTELAEPSEGADDDDDDDHHHQHRDMIAFDETKKAIIPQGEVVGSRENGAVAPPAGDTTSASSPPPFPIGWTLHLPPPATSTDDKEDEVMSRLGFEDPVDTNREDNCSLHELAKQGAFAGTRRSEGSRIVAVQSVDEFLFGSLSSLRKCGGAEASSIGIGPVVVSTEVVGSRTSSRRNLSEECDDTKSNDSIRSDPTATPHNRGIDLDLMKKLLLVMETARNADRGAESRHPFPYPLVSNAASRRDNDSDRRAPESSRREQQDIVLPARSSLHQEQNAQDQEDWPPEPRSLRKIQKKLEILGSADPSTSLAAEPRPRRSRRCRLIKVQAESWRQAVEAVQTMTVNDWDLLLKEINLEEEEGNELEKVESVDGDEDGATSRGCDHGDISRVRSRSSFTGDMRRRIKLVPVAVCASAAEPSPRRVKIRISKGTATASKKPSWASLSAMGDTKRRDDDNDANGYDKKVLQGKVFPGSPGSATALSSLSASSSSLRYRPEDLGRIRHSHRQSRIMVQI